MPAQKSSILVVDDQLGVRRLIQEIFREHGFRVLTAANGREALDAIAAGDSPSLALIDMKMPIMDGLETLRIFRERLPDVPVLMMTAVGDEDSVSEAVLLGAHSCISKPFDVFSLRELVSRVLEEGRQA